MDCFSSFRRSSAMTLLGRPSRSPSHIRSSHPHECTAEPLSLKRNGLFGAAAGPQREGRRGPSADDVSPQQFVVHDLQFGRGHDEWHAQLPRESTYIERAIPDDQRTEALAWKTAHLWKSNPANAMQLPDALSFADESGDGLIDKEEFKALMQKAGAVGDVNKLFAEIDDGDGLLTAAEVRKLADRNRNKFKAQN